MERSGPLSRGVVLLTMLLVLALLSALAYRLMGNHSLLIAQTRMTFGGDAALSYALGAEEMARQVLYEDWEVNGAEVDDLTEFWAQPLAPFALPEYDNSFLEIQIRDLGNCFNLNSLAGPKAAEDLARLKDLLRDLGIPDQLADAWRDWVDSDDAVSGFGAEDGDYLLAEIPYRSPNQMAAHWSEFALLPGVEFEHLQLLEPLLCALPNDGLSVNINTASARVLASVVPSVTAGTLESFVESPRNYGSVADFIADYPDFQPAADALAVRSEYFEVHVRALIDGHQIELVSTLHRNPADGRVMLIGRNLGRRFESYYQAEENGGNAGNPIGAASGRGN